MWLIMIVLVPNLHQGQNFSVDTKLILFYKHQSVHGLLHSVVLLCTALWYKWFFSTWVWSNTLDGRSGRSPLTTSSLHNGHKLMSCKPRIKPSIITAWCWMACWRWCWMIQFLWQGCEEDEDGRMSRALSSSSLTMWVRPGVLDSPVWVCLNVLVSCVLRCVQHSGTLYSTNILHFARAVMLTSGLHVVV